jgi:O-antigen/teichoic acid export membrane protein
MLHARARKAHFWLVLDVIGRQGIPFVVFLVIARIIGPGEYGQFALAMAFVGLLNVVIFQGIADALIRVDELDERHISTAFWMNFALASLIFLVVQALAGWVAALYRAPDLEPVLRWLALLAPLQALISVQVAMFRRNFDTAVLAYRTLLGRSIGGGLGIGLALLGFGTWSLVALQLVQAAISVWVLWRADPWRPRRVFDLAEARTLARFGSHFMGGSLVTSFGTCIDSLLVGLFFDPTTVGFYVLAARLIEMASFLVVLPLRMLIMPMLSRQSDPQAFAASYETMVRSALMIWMPLLLALGTSAALLPILFGERWAGSVGVLQAMSLAAFSMPLWAYVGESLSAAGRPDLYLGFAGAQAAIVAAFVAVGAQFGLQGASLGWSAASACTVPVALLTLQKVCPVQWGSQISSAMRIALAGTGFVVGFLAVRHVVNGLGWPSWSASLIGTVLGLVLYTTLIEFVLMRGYVTEALRSLKDIVPSRSPGSTSAGASRSAA